MSVAAPTTRPTAYGRDGARPPAAEPLRALRRITSPDSRDDRLYFAQVREDPCLELAALRPALGGTIVVVGSGGCTALSLLAAGTGEVVSVDLNRTQHHLVELKAAACAALDRPTVLAFLGGLPAVADERRTRYGELRGLLSDRAAAHWDAHAAMIERGVIDTGVSERLVRVVVRAMRLAVHARSRVERLLACRTIEEQRVLYEREWDSRRWRLLFRLFLGRRALSGAYDPAFFANVERPSFADHFLARARHTLTELPVADNYFLHQMLGRGYPVAHAAGTPPYLSETGIAAVRAGRDRLTLVDAPFEAHLATRAPRSVHGFALSNIAEWLDAEATDRLFAEVVRTAAPGAVLVFRNFVGWTEVPERWRTRVVEDREAGEALMRTDRSLVQRRFAVCRVVSEGR